MAERTHSRIRAAMARPDRATFVDLPSQDIDDLLQERDELLAVVREASDHLAEMYAKYQTKIGPFASQSQRINVKARAAIAKAEGGAHG